MLNLAQNPVLRAAIAAALQTSINRYEEAFKQLGYVRFDRPLLDANNEPITDETGAPIPDLMTEFRTLATTLNDRMEFAKTPQVIEFVRKALGTSLVMPAAFTLTEFKERPARTDVDPATGEIITRRALKAQVVASFGKVPSRLNADALARNAAVAAKWNAILGSAKSAAPETPSPAASDSPSEV